MNNKFLTSVLLLAGLAASAVSAKTARLHIDGSRKCQTVTGFGGFAFAATWGDNLTDESTKALFGCDNTNKTLGLNILRARISPDSVASLGSDIWATTINRMRVARQSTEASGRRHLSFASAWTPPGRFTSNGQNVKGHILESKFGDYADFLNCFISRCERGGTDVDYISLQNEPDWEPDYEGCVWPAKSFISFYSNYASSVNRPLIGPEYLGFSRNLTDSILNSASAMRGLAIVAGHIYGSGNFDYPLIRQKGKEKWMTEFLVNAEDMGYESTHNYNWDDAIYFGRVVNTSMLANFNAWVHYALMASYGLVGDGTKGTTNNAITKRGYVMAHFAKYVTGTTRLHTVLSDPDYSGLSASAYLTSGGDTCVVVMLNPTASSIDVEYSLPFMSKGGRRIRTYASGNLVQTNLTFDESAEPSVTCPPKSVCTYLFIKSNERTEPQEPVHQPLWADSLQNYNGQCVHPDGWKVTVNGSVRTSNNYNSFWNSSQTRLMPYTPESPIPAGILLHATSSGKPGQANYGSLSNHRLYLQPGNYRMIWHGVGYNGPQKLYTFITKAGSTASIAYHSGVEAKADVQSSWGSGRDCLDAVADTLDFTIATAGNYELNFRVTYYADNAVNGECMAVVGGITIDEAPVADDIEQIAADRNPSDEGVYNLWGQRVDPESSHAIRIRQGRISLTR